MIASLKKSVGMQIKHKQPNFSLCSNVFLFKKLLKFGKEVMVRKKGETWQRREGKNDKTYRLQSVN